MPTGPACKIRKEHYSGTWSHTDRSDLKAPKDMSKTDFGKLLVQTCTAIFMTVLADGMARARHNRLVKASVFEEKHASGEIHFHFILLAEIAWCFVPLVRALWSKKICVDISTSHAYYWTSFLYVAVPGTGPNDKKEEDLDTSPWLSEGHPSKIDTLKDIPRGARSCDKSRVRRYLNIFEPQAKAAADASLTDKDFSELVVARGLNTVQKVQAYVSVTRDKLRADSGSVAKEEQMAMFGIEAYMC